MYKKTMEGNMINVHVHYVWTVKHRADVLHKSFRVELFQHIKQEALNKKIYIDSINGVENHVHCLVSLTATQTIADVIKNIKGESSYWLNLKGYIPGQFKWQDGYGAFAVSPQNIKKVRNYIFKQEEHHKKYTFDDELEIFKQFNHLQIVGKI
jgi:putative transposase